MYAKVFKSLWSGTLAGKTAEQLVFVFLLAHADRHGEVDIHHGVISLLTGLPEGDVVKALAALEAADFKSRSEESQGARIVRLDEHRDWGWRVVNYLKYRNTRDEEHKREMDRQRQRAKRDVAVLSPSVATSRQVSIDVAHADAEGDAEAVKPSSPIGSVRRSKKASKAENPLDREWLETFDEVWWPDYLTLGRKCSKAAAREVWARIPHREGQADFDRLNDRFEQDRAVWRDERREPRHIPHAETWLRDYLKNLSLEG